MPPAATSRPEDKLKHTLVFRFDCIDLEEDCPWSLANVSSNDQGDLLRLMGHFESITVGELLSGRFHDFTRYNNFAACPNRAAVNRLVELYNAPDSVARFRLSGTKRLYDTLALINRMHSLVGEFLPLVEQPITASHLQKADEYAENKLIDPQLYRSFVRRNEGHFTATSIITFANSIDRDPGIVLGRLENDMYLKHGNGMQALRCTYYVSVA